MHPILARNDWFMEELNLEWRRSHFNMLDPMSGAVLLECRERPRAGLVGRFVRGNKRRPGAAPFSVEIRTPRGEPVASLSREFAWSQSHVSICDEQNVIVGSVLHKGAIMLESCHVLRNDGQVAYVVRRAQIDTVRLEYQFLQGNAIVARVLKHWTGVVNQAMLQLNKYELHIAPEVSPTDPGRLLILGATICLDMVGGTTARAGSSPMTARIL